VPTVCAIPSFVIDVTQAVLVLWKSAVLFEVEIVALLKHEDGLLPSIVFNMHLQYKELS